jgi:hypothetical protein
MKPPATWRTDDPCPACATALLASATSSGTVRQDCPLCGWSTTWATGQKEGRS